jgi:hypothetical protein
MACAEGAPEAGRHEIEPERAHRVLPAVTQTSISPAGAAEEDLAARTEEGAAVVAANPRAENFRNSRRVDARDVSSLFLVIEIVESSKQKTQNSGTTALASISVIRCLRR